MPVKGSSQASIKSFFSPKDSSKPKESVHSGESSVSSRPGAQRSNSWWSAKQPLGTKSGFQADLGSGRPQIKRFSESSEGTQTKRHKLALDMATGIWNSKPKPSTSYSGTSRLPPNTVSVSSASKELSNEQVYVMNLIRAGHSLFYTGAAGTGKSFLLTKIIQALRRLTPNPDHIAVCATTGMAGKNIGGTTIHSWSGMQTFKESADFYIRKLTQRTTNTPNPASLRWTRVKVLVIDEVSMLPASVFEKLDKVARGVRKTNKPFGGIQVVLTGDFFQLPPILDTKDEFHYCFELPLWNELVGNKQIVLHKVFRQKSTDKLTGMLNEIRLGKVSSETITLFKQLERPVHYIDGLEATRIYPLRNQVFQANRMRLDALPGKSVKFQAQDLQHGRFEINDPFKDHISQKVLELKVGAQVLMVVNKQELNLVNGSRGTVISFMTEPAHTLLQPLFTKYGRDEVIRLYNLVLENNGCSNEAIDEKMRAVMEPDDSRLVIELISDKVHGEKDPLVDFPGTGWLLISRVMFEHHGPPPKGELLASRYQYPLILNYALSVHKAQGQTIDRLVVDLNSTFAKGQAYVAVSRATCFDQLQVKGFRESAIAADQKVIDFYNNLAKV